MMVTYAFAGGTSAVLPYGTQESMAFSGTWIAGESWSWALATTQGNLTLGLGQLAGLPATCCFSYAERVYLGQGVQFAFSDNNDPTAWDEQDPGAGAISYISQYGIQDTVNAFETFQGKVAVFGRYSIQIWNVNADPAQFNKSQVLTNIGTRAPLSVQALGELDVFFLDDTGVRSLRVRDSSLNAFAVDIGSPVDIPIQAAIVAGADPSVACGIVEPSTKRYWLFLEDTLYVLSYYPSLKITAWSTYIPTQQSLGADTNNGQGDQGAATYTLVIGTLYYWTPGSQAVQFVDGTNVLTVAGYFVAQTTQGIESHHTGSSSGLVQPVSQTAFTPEKFVVFNGIIYCRDTNGNIFAYGGVTNNSYDNSVANIESPWLDVKQPHRSKGGERFNVAMAGAWQLEVGYDPRGTTATQVVVPYPVPLPATPNVATDSTFGNGSFATPMRGTHIKFKAYTSSSYVGPAVLSSVTEQFNIGDEQ